MASSFMFSSLKAGVNSHLLTTPENSIHRCKHIPIEIIEDIPQEWNVPQTIITDKISQLFDEEWIIEVWNNFIECLKENINHE